MYPNLLFIIFPHIAEKYHQYLQLVSPNWKLISERICLKSRPKPCQNQYCFTGKLFLQHRIIQIGWVWRTYFSELYIFDRACECGDKILINLTFNRVEHELYTLVRCLRMICEKGSSYLVVAKKFVEKIDELLLTAYKPNLPDIWNSVLYGACIGGNLEMVEIAIAKGANNLYLGFGYACSRGQIEVAKRLIDYGVHNIYPTLNNLCYWRLDEKDLATIKFLIEKGALREYNKDDHHAFHYLCKKLYLENETLKNIQLKAIELILKEKDLSELIDVDRIKDYPTYIQEYLKERELNAIV